MSAKKSPARVHRPLRFGDTGEDVSALQKAAQKILDHFKIDYDIVIDGEYGPNTHRGVRMAAIGMGALANNRAALAVRRCPMSAQRLVRRTRPKTPPERNATRRRKSYRQRMRKRWSQTLGERAYQIAQSYVGVMEKGGNNRGPEVEAIIRLGGGLPGQAWCGWFCAACYKLAGSKVVTWQWGAVRLLWPLLGIKKVTQPRKGDLVRYTFDHVGLYGDEVPPRSIKATEGNTGASGAVSDSSTGGDGVYVKVRDKSLVRDYLRVTR